MTIGYYAVIPTRDRPDDLREALQSLERNDCRPHPIIVNNGKSVREPRATQLFARMTPPNISELWNYGLVEAARRATLESRTEWYVAVINDDVVVPNGWFDVVIGDMIKCHADAGCSDQHSTIQRHYVSVSVSEYELTRRLCGYAFVLRGGAHLFADEKLRWWYGDDDLDWRARMSGGLSITAGYPVAHKYPNAQTNANPELIEQTGRDRQTFIEKWGRAPW